MSPTLNTGSTHRRAPPLTRHPPSKRKWSEPGLRAIEGSCRHKTWPRGSSCRIPTDAKGIIFLLVATRLFISYDYDNDSFLKEALVGQSKNEDSPFEFADASVKAHLTGDWEKKVRERIRNADQVAVICGTQTHKAEGIAVEVQIAQDLSKPYFLLEGHKDKTVYKPATALAADKIYTWSWDNLKSLIAGNR